MKLLQGEEAITYNNGIALTNYRVRHIVETSGSANLMSILLENVQSMGMQYKSKPLLLIIGILLIVASVLFSGGKSGVIVPGLIIGAIFIIAYFFTRKHYLTIASAGESINILIKGKSSRELIDYVDTVEEAICRRKLAIAKEYLNIID